MAYRKPMRMVMKDELYLDRRIKIMKVKKKGPQFDVKKIAADLKAKTQITKVRQTKSEFINSIKVKTTAVPARPPKIAIINPLESPMIIDSSDEEDNDLSITCNIHVSALLAPDQLHSFYVPVDIPCRTTQPPRQKPAEPLPPTTTSQESLTYSASNIPRRFDCFVKLDRLEQTETHLIVEDHGTTAVAECKQTAELKEIHSPDASNVKIKLEHSPEDNVNIAATEPLTPTQQSNEVTNNQMAEPSTDNIIRSSIESSFDFNVQLSMPTIETPPPELSSDYNPMVEIPRVELATVKREFNTKNRKIKKVRKPVPMLIPKNEIRIAPRPALPVESQMPLITQPEPQMPLITQPEPHTPQIPQPPTRPLIKLRNISELLESGGRTYVNPQQLLSNRILEAFIGANSQAAVGYQQTASNHMVPSLPTPPYPQTPAYIPQTPAYVPQTPQRQDEYDAQQYNQQNRVYHGVPAQQESNQHHVSQRLQGQQQQQQQQQHQIARMTLQQQQYLHQNVYPANQPATVSAMPSQQAQPANYRPSPPHEQSMQRHQQCYQQYSAMQQYNQTNYQASQQQQYQMSINQTMAFQRQPNMYPYSNPLNTASNVMFQ